MYKGDHTMIRLTLTAGIAVLLGFYLGAQTSLGICHVATGLLR